MRCGVLRGLSRDHKPLDPGEQRRIRASGHSVSEEGRIDGNINISRTIGDHRYKDVSLPHRRRAISCVPEVRVVDVEGDRVDYAVLACDGVWDVMPSQNLLNFVAKRLFSRRVAPGEAAERLCDEGAFPEDRAYERDALEAWPAEVADDVEELLRVTAEQVVQRCIVERAAGIGCDNVSFMMVLFKNSALGKLVMEAVGVDGNEEDNEDNENNEKVKKIRSALMKMWNEVADEIEMVDGNGNGNNDGSEDEDEDDYEEGMIKPPMKKKMMMVMKGKKRKESEKEAKSKKTKKKRRKLVFKEEKIAK